MSNFNLGDEVWFFYNDSTTGNVYVEWINLVNGNVIWISPYEEIMHVHVKGETSLFVMLDDNKKIYSSKSNAINSMINRMELLKNE